MLSDEEYKALRDEINIHITNRIKIIAFTCTSMGAAISVIYSLPKIEPFVLLIPLFIISWSFYELSTIRTTVLRIAGYIIACSENTGKYKWEHCLNVLRSYKTDRKNSVIDFREGWLICLGVVTIILSMLKTYEIHSTNYLYVRLAIIIVIFILWIIYAFKIIGKINDYETGRNNYIKMWKKVCGKKYATIKPLKQ